MKKITSLLLALLLVCLLFTGCGNPLKPSATEPDTTASQPTDTTEPTEDTAFEYAPGTRTDTSYTNDRLGLMFTLNDQMVMATDEEIDNMMQLGADAFYEDSETGKRVIDYSKVATVYEMMAVNAVDSSNVIVMSQKLTLSGMTEDQYIEVFKSQLAQTQSQIEYNDVTETAVGDISFKSLSYSITVGESQTNQTMLLKKDGDRMFAITLTYPNEAARDALLAGFSVIA